MEEEEEEEEGGGRQGVCLGKLVKTMLYFALLVWSPGHSQFFNVSHKKKHVTIGSGLAWPGDEASTLSPPLPDSVLSLSLLRKLLLNETLLQLTGYT